MSDAYQTIRLQRAGAVATLTLDRPQRLNAINKQMLGELQDALEAIERDAGSCACSWSPARAEIFLLDSI